MQLHIVEGCMAAACRMAAAEKGNLVRHRRSLSHPDLRTAGSPAVGDSSDKHCMSAASAVRRIVEGREQGLDREKEPGLLVR
jgi:hypothetical protein